MATKQCNEETSCKSLIDLCLTCGTSPKFQHLLNSRQEQQEYPVAVLFFGPIAWATGRGEVRKTGETRRNDTRERWARVFAASMSSPC